MKDTGPPLVMLLEGAPMLAETAAGSTEKDVLGPAAAAVLPAASEAVPAARRSAMVPVPEMLSTVIVRCDAPEPETEAVPAAVPVV